MVPSVHSLMSVARVAPKFITSAGMQHTHIGYFEFFSVEVVACHSSLLVEMVDILYKTYIIFYIYIRDKADTWDTAASD